MNTTLTLGFLTPIHRLVGLAIGLLFLLNGPSSGCTVYTYPDARQSESVAMNRPSVSGAMIPEDGHRVGAASILTLLVKGDNGSRPGVSDDSLLLSVRSSVQAFVHCYFRSSTGRVFRILPNDDSSLTLFVPGQSVTFAVANKLRYSAGLVAEAESFLCLASAENVEDRLPSSITTHRRGCFLVHDFDKIYSIYRQTTHASLVGRSLTLAESWPHQPCKR